MSSLVVDTSVAVKWFVREELSDAAEALWSAGLKLHAPDLMWLETANALWKKWRKKDLPLTDVGPSVTRLREVIDRWHDDIDLVEAATAMSLELDHPVYDCVFLVLAHNLKSRVISADQRLLAAAPAGLAIALADWNS